MKRICMALVASVGLSVPAGAATVVNGSFEDSPGVAGLNGGTFGVTSWDIWTSIPGWTKTSGDGIEVQSNSTLGDIDAHSGNHYVELDSNNNSAMKQSVFLTAGTYLLSFFYAPRVSDAATNGIDFSIAGLSDTITGPDALSGTTVGNWTKVVRDFTIGADGFFDLAFAASGSSTSYGGLIDDVSIEVAPVPVPAAGLLMLGGLGGLAALKRRRRA